MIFHFDSDKPTIIGSFKLKEFEFECCLQWNRRNDNIFHLKSNL